MFIDTLIILSAILFFFLGLLIILRFFWSLLGFSPKKNFNDRPMTKAEKFALAWVWFWFVFPSIFIVVSVAFARGTFDAEPRVSKIVYDEEGRFNIIYYKTFEEAKNAENEEKVILKTVLTNY
jgi:phosphate/sulfate permease